LIRPAGGLVLKICAFQDFRHSLASQLVMAGVDNSTLKELLGHKTLAMMLRYAHLGIRV